MLNVRKYKEIILILTFSLICLLLYFIFPTQGFSQKITSLVIFFVIFPLLFQKVILKKELGNLGLTIGNWKKGLIFSFISLALSFLVLFLLFKYPAFQKNYSIPAIFSENFYLFIVYEIFIMGFFYLCFSFFFNGFILFSLERKFKNLSLIISFILFILFMFLIGNLVWLSSFMIMNIFFGSIIALKSRSLLYPSITGLLFYLIADSLVIKFLSN